jgi:hypothetical protein
MAAPRLLGCGVDDCAPDCSEEETWESEGPEVSWRVDEGEEDGADAHQQKAREDYPFERQLRLKETKHDNRGE